MPIVPVYRLRATNADPYPRYRFSRDAHPDPNPVPGKSNPDPRTQWILDRVAFYAWSDPVESGQLNSRLLPVYEFFSIDGNGLVRYFYSTDPNPPTGWTARAYVAYWAYPAKATGAGIPVYLFSQRSSEGMNYALSVNRDASASWTLEGTAFLGATTVPIEVSVRQDPRDSRRYHWTYTPSTINISYPCTLQFTQAPLSDWRFLDLEILDGGRNFDPPAVTDRVVLVNARYAEPGRDFKYRVTIQVYKGPEKLVGDPEIKNQDLDGV